MWILFYGAGVIGSIYALYLFRSGCEVTVLALHDNFVQLKNQSNTIPPLKLNLLRLCPVGFMAWILPFVYSSAFGDRFMYQHAMKAKGEMDQLYQVFYGYLCEGEMT